MYRGEPVSSTRIRCELREHGNVEDAAAMMTRLHELVGVVIQGDQRGRALGFPTANLNIQPPLQLPKDGVYAIVARVLDENPRAPLLQGVANLGIRPTFHTSRSFEIHCFDLHANLYGKTVRVGFVARLRPEIKFDGLQSLRNQIATDCKRARIALNQVNQELVHLI